MEDFQIKRVGWKESLDRYCMIGGGYEGQSFDGYDVVSVMHVDSSMDGIFYHVAVVNYLRGRVDLVEGVDWLVGWFDSWSGPFVAVLVKSEVVLDDGVVGGEYEDVMVKLYDIAFNRALIELGVGLDDCENDVDCFDTVTSYVSDNFYYLVESELLSYV